MFIPAKWKALLPLEAHRKLFDECYSTLGFVVGLDIFNTNFRMTVRARISLTINAFALLFFFGNIYYDPQQLIETISIMIPMSVVGIIYSLFSGQLPIAEN